ncbi:MAG: DUF6449 domain-containing protein [Clostridium sp.]
MTSASLFFKLQKEDLKRRIWVIALLFLGFFFAYPVNLALIMENAANSQFAMYNGYTPLVDTGTPEYLAKVLEYKTKAVVDLVSYGNVMPLFLMVTAAVVIGAAGFVYLHNQKKVDFYHSLPVRREMLYLVYHVDGILILAVTYLIHLLVLTAAAAAYGVSPAKFAGPMLFGFFMNLLYYMVTYETVIVAMMMTGKIIVGLLATVVFFSFFPVVGALIEGFEDIFFITANQVPNEALFNTLGHLSPVGAYIMSLADISAGKTVEADQILGLLIAICAGAILGLELYRKRPMEAAGKAMAFKKTMAPIRILIVLAAGMGTSMFFWTLQSRLRWGLFGMVVGILLAHCIIEIIYQADFKKLFSHKIQLMGCVAAGVLFFLSFRYDWYGYDRFIPEEGKIASAGLELSIDENFLNWYAHAVEEDGKWVVKHTSNIDFVQNHMQLTDMDTVLTIAEAGVTQAAQERKTRFDQFYGISVARTSGLVVQETAAANAVSVIGGADGPTSIFVAGKVGSGESDPLEKDITISVNVFYNLKNGKQVGRCYNVSLNSIMSAYDTLYASEEYKKGLYPVFEENTGELSKVVYKEAGSIWYQTQDSAVAEEVLKAYQADLLTQTVADRRQEDPVGSLVFIDNNMAAFLQQQGYWKEVMEMPVNVMAGGFESGYYYDGDYTYDIADDYCVSWPVYPSFKNTMEVLKKQSVVPGSYMTAKNIQSTRIDLQSLYVGEEGAIRLPQGDELEKLKEENPHYSEQGRLDITDSEEIAELIGACQESSLAENNGLCSSFNGDEDLFVYVTMKNGSQIRSNLDLEKLTSRGKELFTGIPVAF